MSRDFYAGLAPLRRFADITDPSRYVPLPEDWHLALTDVRGSTEAIAEGRYKEVNMVGAATIIALLNVARPLDLPFVFGGDGATVALPPALLGPARAALGALQALATQSFGLTLRAGVVSAAELAAAGHPVRLARLAVTAEYDQAVFFGGLAHAEHLVKSAAPGSPYLVPPAADAAAADLSGLECRWQDVPSRHGETVSLLVVPAPGRSDAALSRTLREVIATIEAIYGGDRDCHPLAVELMTTAYNPARLLAEARARVPAAGLARLRYLARIWGLNLALGVYRRGELLLGRVPWWDRYRDLVFRTADYRKYDDTLRMILAGTAAQRERLEDYLEARFRAGELAYGVQVADRALMTCLVFERMGRQVHFVDGADGGYALAARAMKERLAALTARA